MNYKYGPNKLVDIQLVLKSVKNCQVFESNSTLSFDSSVSLNLWVEKDNTIESREKAISIDLTDAVIGYEAKIADSLNMTLELHQLLFNGCNITSVIIPEIDINLIMLFIDKIIPYTIPAVNEVLANWIIEIPTDLFYIFSLTDLKLNYHNGYVSVELNPTFKPIPSTFNYIQVPDVSVDRYGKSYPYKHEFIYSSDEK
jgi:hypothetical protein